MATRETRYGVLELPELVRDIPMEQFLREQLGAGQGCPLCRAAEHEEFTLFASLIGDIMRDANHPLLKADPLCNRHAVFFLKVGQSKSTAHLCLHSFRRQLALPANTVIEPTKCCPACELLRSRQREWLSVFEALINDSPCRETYTRGYGVCLPHYQAAMAQFTCNPAVELLERTLRPQCERLMPQLELVIERGALKVSRKTADSPRWALEKLFGCAGLTDYLALPNDPVALTPEGLHQDGPEAPGANTGARVAGQAGRPAHCETAPSAGRGPRPCDPA